jgi:hypothetical protein
MTSLRTETFSLQCLPRLRAALLGLLVLCCSARAAAQANESDPGRDASARSLFEEGVKFAEQSQWENAVDRFRRALSLRNSSVITYNLATALIERGKLVEASELLRKVEQDEKVDASMKQSAQKQRAALADRIGRIAVVVHGKQPGDVVRLDDAELLDAQLGVDIPIDPGSHQLRIARGADTLDQQSVEVAPGGGAQVTLVAPAELAPEAAAATAVETQPSAAPQAAPAALGGTPSDSPALTSRWWFWTGIGAVVVGAVVVGVVLAANGGSQSAPAYKGDFTPRSLNVEVKP